MSDAARPEVFLAQDSGHRLECPSRILWWRHYKYVMNFADVDELYDLERDPAELHNLIDNPAMADARRELQRRLLNRMTELDDDQGPQWQHFLERPLA